MRVFEKGMRISILMPFSNNSFENDLISEARDFASVILQTLFLRF